MDLLVRCVKCVLSRSYDKVYGLRSGLFTYDREGKFENM